MHAQTPDQVLIVINKRSRDSQEIGEYYLKKRGVPLANLCTIDTPPSEKITREAYDKDVRGPVGDFLQKRKLVEKILYIVTTGGVPLWVLGDLNGMYGHRRFGRFRTTLLYQKLHGVTIPLPGPLNNPFFQQRDAPFRHPQIPMYMVTRLAGYDMAEMKGLVDSALLARNTANLSSTRAPITPRPATSGCGRRSAAAKRPRDSGRFPKPS